jgi:hypothetical protein
VYLLKEKALRDTRISWAERRISEPSATSTSTTQWTAGAGLPDTLTSRGYREEQEHLAWLIRNPGKGVPRCGAEVGPRRRGGDPGLEHGGKDTKADRVQALLV